MVLTGTFRVFGKFTVRLAMSGDYLCTGHGLINNSEEPLVEFLVESQPNPFFVGRYRLSTLQARSPGSGLCLDGGNRGWDVSGELMDQILQWAQAVDDGEGHGQGSSWLPRNCLNDTNLNFSD